MATIREKLAEAGFGTLNKYGDLKLATPPDARQRDAGYPSRYRVGLVDVGGVAHLALIAWRKHGETYRNDIDRSIAVYDLIPKGATLRLYDVDGTPTSTFRTEFQVIHRTAFGTECGYGESVNWPEFPTTIIVQDWRIE